MKALLQQALDALEYHVQQTRPIHQTTLAIEALRAELAKDDLKTLAQKGCGDCFQQDCAWPTCMSKGTP